MSFFKVVLATVLGFFASMFVMVLLAVALVAGIIASFDNDEVPNVHANSVLEVDLSKSFAEFNVTEGFAELMGSHRLTLRDLCNAIAEAAGDEHVVGMRLKASGSPGSWASAEAMRRAIESFRSSGKFVIATIGERGAAEGSYFVASAAESIVAVPGAHIEMNGIAAALPFFKTAMDRLGIQAQVVRAGTFKSAVEPFILDSASSETLAMTREIVDGTFAIFRTTVANARRISPGALQQILSTRGLMTADEARGAGLVDLVMYNDQIDSMFKSRTKRDPDDDVVTISVGEYAQAIDLHSLEQGRSDQIAIVYAVGEITSGKSGGAGSPFSSGASLGSETFSDAMETARESKAVKAVVVRISSPGGEAGPSEAMWREISLTAAKKPVIASMGAVAASGGYFLAAACDTIVAEPTTITGSIGVFGLWFTMREFMRETLGINVQVVRSDSLADMLSMMRAPTDLERAIMQRSVDSTYQKFLRVVSKGRGISMAQADGIGQGRVFTGTRAKQLKLVDELGGIDRAVEIAAVRAGLKDGSYGIRVLPTPRSFVDMISEAFDQTSLSEAVRAFFGSPIDAEAMVRAELIQRSGVQMLGPTITVGVE